MLSESINGAVKPPIVTLSRSEKKRTPEMLAAICKLVQKGLSLRHASERLHVHHTTIAQWRKDLPDFDAAISAAESAFIEEQTANIRKAGKRNWQASAWLLERRWPQFFSQPQIQLNMGVNKPEYEDLSVAIKKMREDPELLKAVEEINAIGVQKWILLNDPKRQEKAAQAIEIEDAKPGLENQA